MSKKLTAYSNVYNPVHRKSDTENPLTRICNLRAYYAKIIKKALTIARKGSVHRSISFPNLVNSHLTKVEGLKYLELKQFAASDELAV